MTEFEIVKLELKTKNIVIRGTDDDEIKFYEQVLNGLKRRILNTNERFLPDSWKIEFMQDIDKIWANTRPAMEEFKKIIRWH